MSFVDWMYSVSIWQAYWISVLTLFCTTLVSICYDDIWEEALRPLRNAPPAAAALSVIITALVVGLAWPLLIVAGTYLTVRQLFRRNKDEQEK